MKRSILIILLFSVSNLLAQGIHIELVWADEFNKDGGPDPSFWTYDLGTGQNGWGNQEMQSYTSNRENVRVENGLLIIEARKSGEAWTSARLKTQKLKSFAYGRIVFRARLPEGNGTWPALWMLGENISEAGWPACGEIDVMEHVGKNPGVVQAALHTPASHGNTTNVASTKVASFHSDFHTYEAIWTSDSIVFRIDGSPFYTFSPPERNAATWPFDKPFFIIMNIAMGGGFGSDPALERGGLKNGIDPQLVLARMEVDYVRVYQPYRALNMTGPTTVAAKGKNIAFSVNHLEGAAYEWTLPAGVGIVSGQGTSSIVVNWGKTGGRIAVKVIIDGKTVTKSVDVRVGK